MGGGIIGGIIIALGIALCVASIIAREAFRQQRDHDAIGDNSEGLDGTAPPIPPEVSAFFHSHRVAEGGQSDHVS